MSSKQFLSRHKSNGTKTEEQVTDETKSRGSKDEEALETLWQSESKYRQLAEVLSEGIWAVDKKGVTTYVNSKMANMLGYKVEEIIGKPVFDFMDAKGIVTAKAVLKRGEGGGSEQMEQRFIRKDGAFITALVQISPLIDEGGNFLGSIAGVLDITERKKADEELYKSRELLSNIINSSASVILARDLDGKLILLNDALAKVYKMPKQQALGTTLYDVYPKKVADEIGAWDRKILEEKKPLRYEEVVNFNGEPRTYLTNKFPICNSEGRIYGIGAVVTDITERKRMENELDQYNKNLEKLVEERTRQLKDAERLATIGQTAGMVGHDIRNPLQSITNELYFAKQAMEAIPQMRYKRKAFESINIVQEQVDYINKIVSDLQDYARPLNPEYQDTDLSELLTSSLSTIAFPENIDFSIHVKGASKLETDPTFLRRALANLASNAVQAMPDGGKLTISASEKENKVTIVVEDTGKGIPEQVKSKLFTPLFTTKAKGQGFGLAVTKRLIEALGGLITFESQEGKGTKFIIELPQSRPT